MEGNDDGGEIAGLGGSDLGVDLGGGNEAAEGGGAAGGFEDTLDAFGGLGEAINSTPKADPLTEAAPTAPAGGLGGDDGGLLEADLLAVGRDQSSAAKTPEERLEELVGPDPFAILYNGPTGFYGLDSGLETIEGLKEEFTTVARNLAHYYVKTDGMRGAPAANLAIKRLLPHYPELHGIITVPPLPSETSRPPVRVARDQAAPIAQTASIDDGTTFGTAGLGPETQPGQDQALAELVGEGGVNTGEDAGAEHAPNRPNPIAKVGPPTNQPVDAQQMFKALGFDPNGPTEFEVLRIAPIDSWVYYSAAGDAFDATDAQFPGIEPRSNTADAFRHALWSYKIAKTLGAEAAKRLTDAHEVTVPNSDDERLMDLYNNNVGRRLAADPRNQNRSDEEVVLEAIRNGQLQEKPFKFIKTP